MIAPDLGLGLAVLRRRYPQDEELRASIARIVAITGAEVPELPALTPWLEGHSATQALWHDRAVALAAADAVTQVPVLFEDAGFDAPRVVWSHPPDLYDVGRWMFGVCLHRLVLAEGTGDEGTAGLVAAAAVRIAFATYDASMEGWWSPTVPDFVRLVRSALAMGARSARLCVDALAEQDGEAYGSGSWGVGAVLSQAIGEVLQSRRVAGLRSDLDDYLEVLSEDLLFNNPPDCWTDDRVNSRGYQAALHRWAARVVEGGHPLDQDGTSFGVIAASDVVEDLAALYPGFADERQALAFRVQGLLTTGQAALWSGDMDLWPLLGQTVDSGAEVEPPTRGKRRGLWPSAAAAERLGLPEGLPGVLLPLRSSQVAHGPVALPDLGDIADAVGACGGQEVEVAGTLTAEGLQLRIRLPFLIEDPRLDLAVASLGSAPWLRVLYMPPEPVDDEAGEHGT